MRLEVTLGRGLPVAKLPMEFVERKGKGHPDVICDRASEELSISLSRYYIEAYGRILHHNVDKCILAGGRSNARFGGGQVMDPIYLLLVGKAVVDTEGPNKVPLSGLVVEHTKEWLRKEFRFLDVENDIVIDYRIRPGSPDLIGNYEEDPEIPRANDTSLAVSYAPLTDTEKTVYRVEETLNSEEVKRRHPEIGEDIKVMGVRHLDEIHLTVAAATISSLIPDAHRYAEVKESIGELALEAAAKITQSEVSVSVNTADNPEKNIYYLTVTGTSAESGDDGQVGRGNRANGLITPYRPMTLEATAGKNPTSHVGKIYNIAAQEIVQLLIKERGDVEQAYCYMVSEIGKPITEPQAVNIEVHTSGSLGSIRSTAASITEQVLEDLPKIWRGILNREYQLF
ncbi:MAG: methionine adenosyltransferase [Candidatus Geothermarchaeales archaeon]